MSSDTPNLAPSAPDSDAYLALRQGVGFYRHQADFLQMTGEDRARFLNGQATCDVSALAPGTSTYGFFTTAKGRVESDVVVSSVGESLWLHLPEGCGSVIADRLRKYIIVDRVEVIPGDLQAFSCVGPNAEALKAELPTNAWTHQRDDGFDVWMPTEKGSETQLEEVLGAAGAVPVDHESWNRYRVETGRPKWGEDFGLNHFPQETGLEDAVCYTKGCYLGQEVVARIHYRGGVQKRLRGLHLEIVDSETGALIAGKPESLAAWVGAALTHDGKSVGTLTSTALTTIFNQDEGDIGWLGLGIVHDKAPVGSSVEVKAENGARARARVVELPFT